MQPTRVTDREFQQGFRALSDKARHEPVVITEHGRDSLDRRVGLTTELPEEWVEAASLAAKSRSYHRLSGFGSWQSSIRRQSGY